MACAVTPLPGSGCRHYQVGRCLYEEHRNPGLCLALRCAVLTRLGRAFDEFLLRADMMGLSEDQAGRLWQARFPSTLAKEGDCQDYLPGDRNSFPDCLHADGELCLLAFPVCPGRCRRFLQQRAL
jgi:hypothetical protein